MVKHIVMWTLKDDYKGLSKSEIAIKIKKMLLDLKPKIKELRHIEVGINKFYPEKNHDVVLITEFENLANLESYAIHPEHQKVVAFIKEVITGRAAVDCEI